MTHAGETDDAFGAGAAARLCALMASVHGAQGYAAEQEWRRMAEELAEGI